MKSIALAAWLVAAPGWAQQAGMIDRLMALDLNGDGAITRAEAERARVALFDRLDAGGDGRLSQSEQSTMSQGGGVGQRLAQADADGDRRISRDEMMAQPYRGFERLDVNNDGVVSADELAQVPRR